MHAYFMWERPHLKLWTPPSQEFEQFGFADFYHVALDSCEQRRTPTNEPAFNYLRTI